MTPDDPRDTVLENFPKKQKGSSYVIQSVLTPLGGIPANLYLRSSVGPAEKFVQAAGTPTRITLRPDEILTTDTFFGSFYHQYWLTHTVLEEFTIRVEHHGECIIRAVQDVGQGVELLAETTVSSDGSGPRRHVTEVPLYRNPLPGAAEERSSRIFVEVEAVEKCTVFSIDYVSDVPPPSMPELSVGLCTFNREDLLTKTLEQLVAFADEHKFLVGVHVVNQGEPFTSAAILPLVQHPRVHVVEQRNLGGAGGFTRSIVEAETAEHLATHHLLMDDDVFIDARFLLRALRFIAYARRDIAVGAGMFDSLHPRIMFEAGAFVDASNRLQPYCHNVNLANPGELWHFNQPVDTDYNAWWFCVLPLERCRKIGLPNPIFIRGDDFEYGQRLAADDVRTITLPGIAVWHEPFHAKPPGWQDYYDLRNRLIFGATHPGAVTQLSRAHILGSITTAVLTQKYSLARLRLRAVKDFLGGPAVLFSHDPAALHQEIMQVASEGGPTRLGQNEVRHTPQLAGKPMPGTMGPLIFRLSLAFLRAGFGPIRRKRPPLVMDRFANPRTVAGRDYILTNGAGTYNLHFRASRLRLWSLMWQALMLGISYGRRVGRVDRDWDARISHFQQPEFWATVFHPELMSTLTQITEPKDTP